MHVHVPSAEDFILTQHIGLAFVTSLSIKLQIGIILTVYFACLDRKCLEFCAEYGVDDTEADPDWRPNGYKPKPKPKKK